MRTIHDNIETLRDCRSSRVALFRRRGMKVRYTRTVIYLFYSFSSNIIFKPRARITSYSYGSLSATIFAHINKRNSYVCIVEYCKKLEYSNDIIKPYFYGLWCNSGPDLGVG